MRVWPIFIIILFIATSCQNNKNVSLDIDSNVKQIIFFSDESDLANLQVEAPYYDAIIELRQEFPEEFRNMKTLTPNHAEEYYSTFKVSNCPALVILYEEKVIAKVVGEHSKEDIIKPITAALK